MFGLVNDVAAYPEFVGWCHQARVLSTTNDKVVAELTVGYGRWESSFTTENRLDPPERMEMTLVAGPFKSFRGIWTFDEAKEGGCRVALVLEFEFKNRLMAVAAGPAFQAAANRMVDEFVARAGVVYG